MVEKKKKKVDYEALGSPFMRLPKMDVVTVRGLINLGYCEVFQLIGVAPERLYEEMRKKNLELTRDSLYRLRMAVYYAENPDCDPRELDPLRWSD